MKLTKENCPGHTAFMPLDKLIAQFENDNSMFLYQYNNAFAGYVSLSVKNYSAELNNLAVLPEYRHLGIGKKLVKYAANYSKSTLCLNKIEIGIVEENTVLKEWYRQIGFIHTGTKKFEYLPFMVGYMELKL